VKATKRHIIYAWIIMFCFTAGQWAMYAHYHKVSKAVSHILAHSHAKTTLSEKCQLCDAMHNTKMVQGDHNFAMPVVAAMHFYKPGNYDFVSIGLILSSGRAPPVA
jgi:hypothetical protein